MPVSRPVFLSYSHLASFQILLPHREGLLRHLELLQLLLIVAAGGFFLLLLTPLVSHPMSSPSPSPVPLTALPGP